MKTAETDETEKSIASGKQFFVQKDITLSPHAQAIAVEVMNELNRKKAIVKMVAGNISRERSVLKFGFIQR